MPPEIWKLKPSGWARKGYPDVPATILGSGSGVERKSGAGYVRYEDLYSSNDSDLQVTLNKVQNLDKMTFPEGEFIIPPSFSKGFKDGIRVGNGGATNCNGISGSGKNTVFKMLTSTATQPNYAEFEANNFFLMQANGENWPGGRRPGMEFSQFTLEGTQLGADHDHNGLRFDSCLNLLVEDVWVTGIKGSNKIPPGETGSISLFRNTGGTIRRVDLDGRRNGTRVSAALLMPNNGSNLTVEDSYFHHTRYGGGGIAWYVYDGGVVRNCRSHYIGTGSGIFAGYSFNHEQANNIVYYNPDMISDRNTTGGTGHMSINSDSARGGVDNTLTVYNPKWDATGVGGGRFYAEIWNLGANQVQRKPPTVYGPDGVTLLQYFLVDPYNGSRVIN
jgi:hypothetical protein